MDKKVIKEAIEKMKEFFIEDKGKVPHWAKLYLGIIEDEIEKHE